MYHYNIPELPTLRVKKKKIKKENRRSAAGYARAVKGPAAGEKHRRALLDAVAALAAARQNSPFKNLDVSTDFRPISSPTRWALMPRDHSFVGVGFSSPALWMEDRDVFPCLLHPRCNPSLAIMTNLSRQQGIQQRQADVEPM